MRLGPLKSWLVGIAITITVLILAAATPIGLFVLVTAGSPYEAFSMMFDGIFEILGIDRAGTIALYALPALAGIASSVFYGAVVYFASFVLDSLRRRNNSGLHN